MEYHKSFENFISTSRYLNEMKTFVDNTKNLCPKKENVFRFLNNDLSNIKCIILGMDPYTSTYENNGKIEPVATGRAFEVANICFWTDKYKQVSLSNIFKTLCYMKFGKIYSMSDLRKFVTIENFRYLNVHDWFDNMEKQGVIFLNATLTSLIGMTGVHQNVWKNFVNETIQYILSYNQNIKWLIWGGMALKRVEDMVMNSNIIYSCHPATRVNNTFVNDCCFKRIKNIEWV